MKTNSPGQRPSGVLDNEHVGFWLHPPYPPSRQLGSKQPLLGLPQICSNSLVTAFFVFLMVPWALPRHHVFLPSIFDRKNCQNCNFWPPKPPPKPIPKRPKIDVQKTRRFLLFFERCSFKLQTFETLKISVSPRREHYF